MTIFGGNGANGALDDTWTLTLPGLSGLSCTAASGVPNIVRAEGIAELVGDVVFNCVGGTPTPAGEPIPEYDVTLTLNTNIISRRLPEADNLSEALLTIDEPFPAVPVPSGLLPRAYNPPQIPCVPLGSHCTETGTGGTPNPYQTQPNVFAAKQHGANSLHWKVPIDPPGANNFVRVIRLTNIRANASQLGLPSGFLPESIQATVAIERGDSQPAATAQQLPLGQSVPGTVLAEISSASIPQCQPHNAVLLGGAGTAAFDVGIQIEEGFAQAFKYRNYGTALFGPVFPPELAEQNVPGFDYNTETGFYSPSLFTTAPALGLADSGTRILVSLGSVPAGTHLFVPTAITLAGQYGEGALAGQLQLVQADQNGKSTAGYEPVASSATIGATPVAEASRSGSTAYAVYEVVYASPFVQETANIPIAVAFTNKPAVGQVNVTTSLGPLGTAETADESSPIPRFSSFATAVAAYSINTCPAP